MMNDDVVALGPAKQSSWESRTLSTVRRKPYPYYSGTIPGPNHGSPFDWSKAAKEISDENLGHTITLSLRIINR